METFTWIPDAPISKDNSPTVRVTKLGDGYEQRQAFGINNNLKKWSLTFNLRAVDEIDDIEAFLDARGGVESFLWTHPYESTPRTVVCREWPRTDEKAFVSSIRATFEEVAEPG